MPYCLIKHRQFYLCTYSVAAVAGLPVGQERRNMNLHSCKIDFSPLPPPKTCRQYLFWHVTWMGSIKNVYLHKHEQGSSLKELKIQDVSKRALQMLLCGECYENVYTYRRTNYPSFHILRMQISWFVRNSVCNCSITCFIRQRCYVACGKKLTIGGMSVALPVEVTLNRNSLR
jgi:hypothetical protein